MRPRSRPGGIAQLVERFVRNEEARGSNPLTSKAAGMEQICPFGRHASIAGEHNPLTSTGSATSTRAVVDECFVANSARENAGA